MANNAIEYQRLLSKYESVFNDGLMISGLSLDDSATLGKLIKAMQKALDTGEPIPHYGAMWDIPDGADT
jgi:hypothetical protein